MAQASFEPGTSRFEADNQMSVFTHPGEPFQICIKSAVEMPVHHWLEDSLHRLLVKRIDADDVEVT